jgi:ankyrin repeat protein
MEETIPAKKPAPKPWLFALIPVLILGGAAAWWFSPGQVQMRKDRDFKRAVSVGKLEVVEAQIRNGANVNARYKDGMRPLMYAAKGERPKLKHPEKSDHPAVVELLIQKGADPNSRTDKGMTPLFWAARYGHPGAARVLLEHQADPNVKDQDGQTPLKWATTNKFPAVIELLKKAGAKE